MINSFRHFGITVSSLERALSFYCGGLGFEVTAQLVRPAEYIEQVTGVSGTPVNAAVVSGYGIALELLEYSDREDRPERGQPPHYPGMAHICLEVEDLDASIEHLIALGAIFKGNPTVVPSGAGEGNEVIYGWDPDGIPFELVQVKE